ncbi:hypothetical protein SEA_ALAKAZAM_7 [Microbacterium phage Alakazam]|nr:hypothetical protein SEA_ALAKAZAM_7 [Microbacterium phage Alakazam]
MGIRQRLTDTEGFEEVPSEIDQALALVPEYDASKEEETRVITGDTP